MRAVTHTGRIWPAVGARTRIHGMRRRCVRLRGGQEANNRGLVTDRTTEPSPDRGTINAWARAATCRGEPAQPGARRESPHRPAPRAMKRCQSPPPHPRSCFNLPSLPQAAAAHIPPAGRTATCMPALSASLGCYSEDRSVHQVRHACDAAGRALTMAPPPVQVARQGPLPTAAA